MTAILSDEQKSFYASMEGTFNTPGWELMRQGWQNEVDQLPLNAFFNANSVEDLRAARVRYAMLKEMIDLPETIENQKINAINEVDGPGEYV